MVCKLIEKSVFENVMYEQMVNYFSCNGLISSFQSGFTPGHSTATAIARVTDDIRLNMESNQPTILVLLTFQRPFTVCVKDCSFLNCVSATAFMLRQFSSYLFSRYQKVSFGGDVSPLAPLVASVPQGSPISPLCFSMFIDDMTEILEFSKYHMYADDLQICHSRSKEMLFECISEM
jgi:hypothetical protein